MVKIKIASVNDLRLGGSKVVETDVGNMAFFNVNGSFFATSNTCLHKGGPLGEGSLIGPVVSCPWHGWEYNISTGENLTNPSRPLKTYRVFVEDNEIFIEF